jgi:hypothetical protein
MKTQIVSVFPACGRRYLYKNQGNILIQKSPDERKSTCSIINCGGRYSDILSTIKKSMGSVDLILFQQNDAILKELKGQGISVIMIVPDVGTSEREKLVTQTQWVGRITLSSLDSGDLSRRLRVFLDNFDDWTCIELLKKSYSPKSIIPLGIGEYLSDIIGEVFAYDRLII